MEFKKYSSIENAYREKFINFIIEGGFAGSDTLYSVSEKVHGANFQILTDGKSVQYGKRTSLLGETGNFYDWQSVIVKNNLESKVKRMFEYLVEIDFLEGEEITELVVYGELAGSGVQKGIYYSPEKFFYGFDIKINGSYVGVDTANRLFEEFEIFYAKELFRGTLTECIEYTNTYNSHIPTWLGVDETLIPEVNICEGNVIKSVEPLYVMQERCILKNKNEKWSEKANKPKSDKPKQPTNLSTEEQNMLDDILQFNTENRLRNVLSKYGKVDSKDFGKIMGLMMQDIYSDYSKEYDVDLKILSKQVKNKVQNECSSLIRSNFINILDGLF